MVILLARDKHVCGWVIILILEKIAGAAHACFSDKAYSTPLRPKAYMLPCGRPTMLRPDHLGCNKGKINPL